MKVLAVSPHPDDVEIGIGGLIHSLAASSHSVELAVCMSDGDIMMAHSNSRVTLDQRKKEQMKAAAILGIISVHWLDLSPAIKFDVTGRSKFVQAFDRLFPLFDQVYLPLSSYHVDHEVVWKASMASMRSGKVDQVSFYAYEHAFGNSVGDQPKSTEFGKKYFRLSAESYNAKLRALACHESQVNGRQDSIYGAGGVAALCKLRGLEIGASSAELVYVLREVV